MNKIVISLIGAILLNANGITDTITNVATSGVNLATQNTMFVNINHSDLGWGVGTELPYLSKIVNIEAMPVLVDVSSNGNQFGFNAGVRKYNATSLFGLFYGAGIQNSFDSKYYLIPHADIGYRTVVDKDIYLDASVNIGYDLIGNNVYPSNIYTNVTTALSYGF